MVHLIKANTGSGTFAMGDAIRNSGIVAGPLLLAFIGVICVFAQHQLVSCLVTSRQNPSARPLDIKMTSIMTPTLGVK